MVYVGSARSAPVSFVRDMRWRPVLNTLQTGVLAEMEPKLTHMTGIYFDVLCSSLVLSNSIL